MEDKNNGSGENSSSVEAVLNFRLLNPPANLGSLEVLGPSDPHGSAQGTLHGSQIRSHQEPVIPGTPTQDPGNPRRRSPGDGLDEALNNRCGKPTGNLWPGAVHWVDHYNCGTLSPKPELGISADLDCARQAPVGGTHRDNRCGMSMGGDPPHHYRDGHEPLGGGWVESCGKNLHLWHVIQDLDCGKLYNRQYSDYYQDSTCDYGRDEYREAIEEYGRKMGIKVVWPKTRQAPMHRWRFGW